MKITKPDYQQYHRYYQIVSDIQKRPNTHLYTTVAFTFLAISLFAWYAIRPTLQTILYLKREIGDKSEVNQKMEEKIASLIEGQSNLAQVEPGLSLLSEAIPQTPDAISLLNQLHSLAAEAGASISSARVSDVSVTGEEASRTGEISLTVTLAGAFEQLLAFVNGMIDMRRIVTIDSLNFTPNAGGSGQESTTKPLQLIIKLRSYYQKE